MKKALFTLFAGCLTTMAMAQKFSINGTVIDSVGKPLEAASVVLLNSTDSSLISFARSKPDGTFQMRNVPQGTAYTMRITFVGYETYLQDIPKDFKGEKFDAGGIRMTAMSKMLDAATITGMRAPITFKGDTTEFNAAAFKTAPNATAEELLKKLPGVEVDKDGNVKAQGESVTKVYVNGKKFFGNDPKIATQNLPAGAVDKVQVYDKKSDQAEFSGVDDGEREKVINFQLKDSYSQGTFGNITAGAGKDANPKIKNDERFNLKGALNRFSRNQQISLIGMGNNINKQGFSMEDYMSYTGATQRMMGGGGRVNVEIDGNNSAIPLDMGRNPGFNNTWASGINFNKTFSPKLELNASYFYNKSNKTLNTITNRDNFLPDNTSYLSNTESNQNTINGNHRLQLTLDHKIDSFNSIRFTNTSSMTDNRASTGTLSKTFTNTKSLRNTGDRTNNTEGDGMNIQNSLLWRHRFAKRGRTMTANFNYNKSNNNNDGLSNSINEYFGLVGGNTALLRKDSTIQNDVRDNNRQNYGTSLTFVEPLAKRTYLELTYAYNKVDNNSDRNVDTIRNGEKSHNYNLSNIYQNDFNYQRAGIGVRYSKRELNAVIGVNYQHSILRGYNETRKEEIKPNPFKYFLPNLRLRYEFSQGHSASIDYDANIQEPSIQQLQPIVDNSNPLSISVGNPNLKPEYTHRIRARYNKFNMMNMTSFFANATVNYTLDKIVYDQTITPNLVSITKPVNVKDMLTAMGFLQYSIPLNKQFRMSLGNTTMRNRYITLVNSAESETKTLTTTQNIRLDYRLRDTFEINLNARVGYNNNKYTLQPNLNRNFLTHDYELGMNYTLPYDFRLQSDFNYLFYTGQTFGANQSIPIWSASMSKFFLKNKRGELKLSIFDILNKNTGFNRTANSNYIQDQFTTALGRYVMMSFTYAINPMFGGPGGRRGGERMMIRMGG